MSAGHNSSHQTDAHVPEAIRKKAADVRDQLLPDKSKVRYEAEYEEFCKWRSNAGVVGVNEEVIVAYMGEFIFVSWDCGNGKKCYC